MNGRRGANPSDSGLRNEGNEMLVRFEEYGVGKLFVPDRTEGKWSPRRTLIFLIASGVLCWSAILFILYLVVG